MKKGPGEPFWPGRVSSHGPTILSRTGILTSLSPSLTTGPIGQASSSCGWISLLRHHDSPLQFEKMPAYFDSPLCLFKPPPLLSDSPLSPLANSPPGQRIFPPESAVPDDKLRRFRQGKVIPHSLFWLVLLPMLKRIPWWPPLVLCRRKSTHPSALKPRRRLKPLRPRRPVAPRCNRAHRPHPRDPRIEPQLVHLFPSTRSTCRTIAVHSRVVAGEVKRLRCQTLTQGEGVKPDRQI
jgi:hypothetical protein